jgi:GT2 family glycosyltransferase
VAETIDSPGVSGGAFRFRLDQRGAAMRLIEWMVDCRSRLLQLPYGDQAIFVRAETFRSVGGFPNTPIMEDYELIRRLRRVGRIAIADGDAVTSARRYRRMGWWRATWTNQVCLIAYGLNVAPERIARWRNGC